MRFLFGGYVLKVSEVDIEIIKQLLCSVPDGMEIKSINLVNGYSLDLTAGVAEITAIETQETLSELIGLIQHYDKSNKNFVAIKKGCQSVDTPQKN